MKRFDYMFILVISCILLIVINLSTTISITVNNNSNIKKNLYTKSNLSNSNKKSNTNKNSNKNSNTNSNTSSFSSTSELNKIAMSLTDTKNLKIKKEMHINDEFIEKQEKTIVVGSILYNSMTKELTYTNNFLVLNNNKKSINPNKKLIARGRYTKSLDTIGWSRLFIETFDNCPSEIQSFAAGYIEGKLTAKNILEFYQNLIGIHAEEAKELNQVFDYYEKVEKFIRKKTSKMNLTTGYGSNDGNINKDLEYWITVALVQAQTDGLYAGYNNIMSKVSPLTFAQIYFINADGEVPELLTVFKARAEAAAAANGNTNKYNSNYNTNKSSAINIDTKFSFKQKPAKEKYSKFSKEYLYKNFGTKNPELLWNKLMLHSHCSALIKCDFSSNSLNDILIGHTTWDSYSEMHRVFKIYDFKFNLFNKFKHSLIMFSSYPGTLTSTDDFYMLNSKIAVVETTLEILDRELYNKYVPEAEGHVPNYIRISIANRLASTGKEWTEVFKRNNSGTYNSQWIIVDYQQLKKNEVKKSFNESSGSGSSIRNVRNDDYNVRNSNSTRSLFDMANNLSSNSNSNSSNSSEEDSSNLSFFGTSANNNSNNASSSKSWGLGIGDWAQSPIPNPQSPIPNIY